jgi:hypothetical protein
MRKTISVDDLPKFDPAKYLDNEESIAVYLTGILEANNAALLASALGDIARARGMTEIAKALTSAFPKGWVIAPSSVSVTPIQKEKSKDTSAPS